MAHVLVVFLLPTLFEIIVFLSNGWIFGQVLHLTDKLLLKEKENKNSELSDTKSVSVSPQEHITDLVSDGEGTKDSVESKYEDLNSAKSYVFDSDSSHCADGCRSSLLDPGDSSYVFEPDHSDLSQDEEDNLSKGLLPPLAYMFPKIEVADDYSYPPANSCYFGFPTDDHTFGFSSYWVISSVRVFLLVYFHKHAIYSYIMQ